MSALAEPTAAPLSESLPSRLSADEANARTTTGQRKAAVLESRLQRQYESSLRATARRCAEAYRARTAVLVAASPPDDPQHHQPPQPTVDEVLNAELAAASANARTQATRRRIAQTVAGDVLAGFDAEPQLRNLLEPLVRAQAGVQAERLVAGVRETVASILLDALVEGWTVPETAAQIGIVLTDDAKWRATMLARTDLIALSNGSAHQAATILGDDGPQYKTWLTAGDDRVRDTHVDANRQTVPVDQPYDVGDSQLMYPGDPSGSDEDVINCRCVSIFSDSPAPLLRHTQDGGIEDGIAVLASAALDDLLTAAFDPALHPHRPGGDEHGGEWAPKGVESFAATKNAWTGLYADSPVLPKQWVAVNNYQSTPAYTVVNHLLRDPADWEQTTLGAIAKDGAEYPQFGVEGLFSPENAKAIQATSKEAVAAGLRDDLRRSAEEQIATLDSVMRPSPVDVTVYRGLGSYAQEASRDVYGEAAAVKPGDVVQDLGFSSTSLDRWQAESRSVKGEQVVHEIVVPKGTPSAYLPAVTPGSQYASEKEVLLARGTRFEAVSNTVRDGVRFIKWRVIR